MKLALPSEYCFFFPRPFAPGPPPGHWPVPPYPSPTPSGPEPGAGPRPPAAAPCPGSGRWGSPTAALGMLRGGRGGRFASQALALGGGRARGCSWSSSARSWSCREFPPHPSLLARGSGSRRGSRERRRASARARQALSRARSPEPRAGQPPGRSLAGWDACRALALPGHQPGCTVGPGRGAPGGRGRGQAGVVGGRGDAAAAAALVGAPGAWSEAAGAGTPLRGPRSRQGPRDAFKLAGGGRGVCAPRRHCFVRAVKDSVPGSPQTWDPVCGEGWASRGAEQSPPRKLRMEPFFPHCPRGRMSPEGAAPRPQCGGAERVAAPLG